MKQTEGEKGRSRSKQNHKQQRMELGSKAPKRPGTKTVPPPKGEDGNFFSNQQELPKLFVTWG